MKILLVNNHTVHLNSLSRALAGHEVEIQTYHPGLEFHDKGKDLIILSGGGGEGLEINDEHQPGKLWYQDEMNLVKTTNTPILGVCMGFEVIARAFGAPITSAGGLVLGYDNVQVVKEAKKFLKSEKLRQYEAHRWRLEDVPSEFEALATSKTGIEMFRFNKILATQFHPEKGGSLRLKDLIGAVT